MTDTPENDKPVIPPPIHPQQPPADVILNNFIWPVVCAAVNGLQLSLRHLPLNLILVRMCTLFGRVIGETVSVGDLGNILKLRAECIKAFTESLREVKPKPAPGVFEIPKDLREKMQ